MVWYYYPGYKKDAVESGFWNLDINRVGVGLNLAKFNDTDLPQLQNGDVIRLFAVETTKVPYSFKIKADDQNAVPIISGMQLRVGLAYRANDEDEETQSGRFPDATNDPFRWQEYFCTINVDSGAAIPRGRIDITDTTPQPLSLVQYSTRRQMSSIRDTWYNTDSIVAQNLEIPYKLDVALSIVSLTPNPMPLIRISMFGEFVKRLIQISDTDLNDLILG